MTMSRTFAALGVAATLGLVVLGGVAAVTHASDHRRGPPGFDRIMPPPPPISDLLARAEVEIGIRAQQLDAWRDFTDTAVAVLEPPHPPKPGTGPASGAEPFKLAISIAEDAAMRGRKAEQLKAAVEVLKSKLTPDQLRKVAEVEARLTMPPPPPFLKQMPIPGTMPDPPRNE